MARVSPNEINSMSADWGNDPQYNLPYSGGAVQRFIKNVFNSKVGSGHFDASTMTLYLFKDDIDKTEFVDDPTKTHLLVGSIPMSFETTQYRIRLTPAGSQNINATVNQADILINIGAQAESRELGEASWNPTGQDIGVRVYVDANSTGNYEEIPDLAQVILSSVGTLSVGVMPYIPVGASRVRLYFYAANDISLSTSIVYNITLAEMYIEEYGQNGIGNTWHKAIVEGGDENNYHIGGFKIVGTIAKTIHIDISTTSSVVASYSLDIGSLEAIDNAYSFTRSDGLDLAHPYSEDGTALPALTTGIYNVKVWLTSGSLSTEDTAITYSIMYVAASDKSSAYLVVMNNSGKIVNNYDESAHLCDYAIYNGNNSSGIPTIVITPYIAGTAGTPTTIQTQVFAETRQALNQNIALVTNSTNLTIRYRITVSGNYQEDVSPVDNSEIFPSEGGAAFYLNTSLRTNGESTKTTVYNYVDNTQVALDSITWERMAWVDGIDGWTEDEEGKKCLMLPARSKLIIPNSSFNFTTGENVTWEFCYKVKNVSDYNENVITIAENPTSSGFFGVRIKPTNVTVHSGSDVTDAEDIYQGTNLADEETIHLLISVQNSFGGGSENYNLVTGYVNGVKNFEFSYAQNTRWASTNTTAIFGSGSADLYLYSVRAYRKALSASGAESNWLNSLTTRSEKAAKKAFIQSVLRSSSRQIDYETIKNNGKYNFFVVEMTSGSANVPSTTYPDGGRSNIEMHYGADANGNSRSSWDWKIYDVETKGQGTTSMNYWLWNIRWRIDKTDGTKKRDINYYDTPVISNGVKTYVPTERISSKTIWFDGNGNHPAVKRITAKINFASSMHSHKMGATKAYTLLHDELEEGDLLNEAQRYANTHSLPSPTVAVYQYPAFGFQKTVSSLGEESYSFIGLFTIGPDKGDKPTFGWDLVEDNLVSLEGTDHTPQMAKFNVPWDAQTVYHVNDNGDGYLSTIAPSGNYVHAFEVGNAKGADTEDVSETMPVLVDSFKGAYDVVYNNSTLIFPIALDDATYGGANAEAVLANINADITHFQEKAYDSRFSYADMEFWIEGEYKLYHYEYESGRYVSGYKSGDIYTPLNLLADTGYTEEELEELTLTQQNDLFKEARRTRFVANAPTYWDMRELVFNYVFLLVFAATDNFAKNQYPYYMGGKWRFRQDDLDTIMDIDNSGGQTKPSYIEFDDAIGGSPYFAGSNSVLWNLVHECLWDDYTVSSVGYPGIGTMGKDMLAKMSELANGDNMYDGFIKFFDKYFWGNAQEYFPPSAYNIDANIKYEAAWRTGRQFSVKPLRQSLGDHFMAERLWVRRRAVYCMSLFGTGAFGDYSQQYLGVIQFRPINLGVMNLTPAETMYPCLIVGANDVRPTHRTPAGVACEFDSLVADGNTVYTLQAVDYLTSLGDLKDLKLGSDDGGAFSLSGKRLSAFKMGDATDTVTTTVTSLNVASAGLPCLEVVDVRNAADLSGAIDLSACKRIKEVYAEGTKVSSVSLPRGSKIEKLHLSEYTTTLNYRVTRHLSDLVLPSDKSRITLVYLENCDAFNPYSTLHSIYNSASQNLSFIRIVSDTEKTIDGPQMSMLVNIKGNLDKSGESHAYHGTDTSGVGNPYLDPYLEGEILAGKHYAADIEYLSDGAIPEDSSVHSGYKRVLASYFGALYITYATDSTHEYMTFADIYVQKICATRYGDTYGTLYSEAAAVTSLNSYFRGNTNIQTFDELKYFGITETVSGNTNGGGDFWSCTNLRSVSLPDSCLTIGTFSFHGCTRLTDLDLGNGVKTISNYAFNNCNSLVYVDIPASVSTIGGNRTFVTSDNLNKRRVFILRRTTPPSLGYQNVFYKYSSGVGTINTGTRIYVPYSEDHSILEAYKTATNWSTYADYFYELDENGNIPE